MKLGAVVWGACLTRQCYLTMEVER